MCTASPNWAASAAVVSLHRLFDIDRQVVYLRAAKIGVHEVGHLLGLEHCWQAGCLMRFSKQLEQLDRLAPGLLRFVRVRDRPAPEADSSHDRRLNQERLTSRFQSGIGHRAENIAHDLAAGGGQLITRLLR